MSGSLDFSRFLCRPELVDLKEHFQNVLSERCKPGRHGDLSSWLQTLSDLPELEADHSVLNSSAIEVGHVGVLDDANREALEMGLRALSPWRKGPFQIFDSYIDTEWRSDWKWQRIEPHIQPLQEKRVLDVGCGTGYHGWRMLGAGARYVLGIDPSMRFLVQFLVLQKYLHDSRFDFLPIGIEDMPEDWPVFDSVFSMGVLYHRRHPENHLRELAGLISPNGELILETLIVDSATDGILRPEGRYAMMRNVWSIMTVDKIIALLRDAGFRNPRCVDQNTTSLQEQRRTGWMNFHSLEQFLDPEDSSKTIEGHPAPKRGTFIADAPEIQT